MTFLATGFQQVDRSSDQKKLIQCLAAIRTHPFFCSVKEESCNLLNIMPGDTILEIGCGTGEDAVMLASMSGPDGRVIGSDISHTILAEGGTYPSSENISFVQMDGRYLAIHDCSCNVVREDRVLQHVQNPDWVIREMFRVLTPGGRCVLFEPDWEAFLIDGINDRITRNIQNFWSDQFAQGHIGRKIRRFCLHAGFSDVKVIPKTLICSSLSEAETLFTISENARFASESGYVSSQEAEEFIRNIIEMDKMGVFFCSFTGYLVSGCRKR